MLGGAAALTYQALDQAEVARAARLSASAASAALRTLSEHGLAERTRHGWRRGGADLDQVAGSTGAATIHQERAQRYREDRQGWRARIRQYVGARNAVVAPGDGWLGLDDEDEWAAMLFSRWPVLDDVVRGPPAHRVQVGQPAQAAGDLRVPRRVRDRPGPGQEGPVVAVYNHYKRVQSGEDRSGDDGVEMAKYDGIQYILLKLIQAVDCDVKKAETGIIYIDEIDSIARPNFGNGCWTSRRLACTR